MAPVAQQQSAKPVASGGLWHPHNTHLLTTMAGNRHIRRCCVSVVTTQAAARHNWRRFWHEVLQQESQAAQHRQQQATTGDATGIRWGTKSTKGSGAGSTTKEVQRGTAARLHGRGSAVGRGTGGARPVHRALAALQRRGGHSRHSRRRMRRQATECGHLPSRGSTALRPALERHL